MYCACSYSGNSVGSTNDGAMPYAIHLMVSHRCVRPPPSQVSLCPFSSHCCLRPPPSQVSCETSSQPLLTLFSQPQEILTLHDEPSLPPSSARNQSLFLMNKMRQYRKQQQSKMQTVQLQRQPIVSALGCLKTCDPACRRRKSLVQSAARLLRQWKMGALPW
ncbi:hypothetical protein FQN60_000106, partial [Etheostoma spectabile]